MIKVIIKIESNKFNANKQLWRIILNDYSTLVSAFIL